MRTVMILTVIASVVAERRHTARRHVRPAVIGRPVVIETVARQLNHLALDARGGRLAW